MKEKDEEAKNESDCFVVVEELNANDPPFWESVLDLSGLIKTIDLCSKFKGRLRSINLFRAFRDIVVK